jgi:hypothetical protein
MYSQKSRSIKVPIGDVLENETVYSAAMMGEAGDFLMTAGIYSDDTSL